MEGNPRNEADSDASSSVVTVLAASLVPVRCDAIRVRVFLVALVSCGFLVCTALGSLAHARVFYDLDVVAKTGSTDSGQRPLAQLDRFPSINDHGRIVFRARVRYDDDSLRENLFSFDPTSREIKPLMVPILVDNNPSTADPVLEIPSSGSPFQIFSAAQVNNNNVAIAQRRIDPILTLTFLVPPGLPVVQTQVPPLTYLEKWDAAATGLPIGLDAAGDPNLSDLLLAPFLVSVIANPFHGLDLPSDFDQVAFSEWFAIQGPRNSAFPTINNCNVTAFVGLGTDFNNYLATILDSVVYPGEPPRARLADNGVIVLRNENPAGRRIEVQSYFTLAPNPTVLAGPPAFSDVGPPAISDDGGFIAFVGNLTPAGADTLTAQQPKTFFGLKPGAGVFVAMATPSDGWVVQRIAGVTGNGVLDPNEIWDDVDRNGVVDGGEDRGADLDRRPTVAMCSRSSRSTSSSVSASIRFAAHRPGVYRFRRH